MLLFLSSVAFAQDPKPASPPPAAVTSELRDDVRVSREVEIVEFRIDNLNPTEEVKPEENFLPQIIEAVEHKPF